MDRLAVHVIATAALTVTLATVPVLFADACHASSSAAPQTPAETSTAATTPRAATHASSDTAVLPPAIAVLPALSGQAQTQTQAPAPTQPDPAPPTPSAPGAAEAAAGAGGGWGGWGGQGGRGGRGTAALTVAAPTGASVAGAGAAAETPRAAQTGAQAQPTDGAANSEPTPADTDPRRTNPDQTSPDQTSPGQANPDHGRLLLPLLPDLRCTDARQIGATAHAHYRGMIAFSVNQYYSPTCHAYYGYSFAWQQFRKLHVPFDVGMAVYNTNSDAIDGAKTFLRGAGGPGYWSSPVAATSGECTKGEGHFFYYPSDAPGGFIEGDTMTAPACAS